MPLRAANGGRAAMKYLLNTSTDPFFNMAFDEYFLEHAPVEEDFFYLWRNRPSVIIGQNQNAFAEVNLDFLRQRGIALARRVTGGGAVYHDLQNMNYTIIGRHVSPQPFAEALRKMGVGAELTGRNDIFVDGKKVSGYARRVSHGREIVHGTMMYDVDIDTLSKVLDAPGSKMAAKGIASVRSRVGNLRSVLTEYASLDEVQARLQGLLSDGDAQIPVTEGQRAEIQRMAGGKFSSWDWVYGRSRAAELTHTRKLPCGTVSAGISLDHGRVSDICFCGDFIGDLPAEGLAVELRGIRFSRESVLEALRGLPVSGHFSGTSAEELADLIMGQ